MALYLMIVRDLRRLIEIGHYRPGTALPSERKLMQQYGVARFTVRRATAVLRQEGIIRVEVGAGMFAQEKPPDARKALCELAAAYWAHNADGRRGAGASHKRLMAALERAAEICREV